MAHKGLRHATSIAGVSTTPEPAQHTDEARARADYFHGGQQQFLLPHRTAEHHHLQTDLPERGMSTDLAKSNDPKSDV